MRLASIFVILLAGYSTASAQQLRKTDPRTERICNLPVPTREEMAKNRDPDGIFCSALAYALRAGDDRYSHAERAKYEERALYYLRMGQDRKIPMERWGFWSINESLAIAARDLRGETPPPPPPPRQECYYGLGASCSGILQEETSTQDRLH
jgi:hypothetical protein